MGHGERGARGARRDEGIAVAVAADPGAEGDEPGQLGEVGLDAVLGGERGGHLGVEDGEGGEDGGLVVVERHADLVAHGGAGHADVVGLPEGGDLGDDLLLEGFELGLGHGDAVKLLQQVEMRRRLDMTERRATSVGCAVKTGVTVMRSSRARAWSAVMPASFSGAVRREMTRAAGRRWDRVGWERRRRLRWLVSARLVSSKKKAKARASW